MPTTPQYNWAQLSQQSKGIGKYGHPVLTINNQAMDMTVINETVSLD